MTEYKIGDIVRFGPYDWRVLAVENGQALLITKNCLPNHRAYHNKWKNITWAHCDLRKWLNGEFYDSFGAEKGRILQTHLDNPHNWEYHTKGGKPTDDYIFCLSIDEAKRYFKDGSDKVAQYRGKMGWWWLRSPGSGQNLAASVYRDGPVDTCGFLVYLKASVAVRPALWLNL
ncbi:MAG: DUF6273 domain-containing protein [Clostridium sp.]|jgi:hypothetical protein|nr:DUF6273 domain-containing protein [Clostridium sp.]